MKFRLPVLLLAFAALARFSRAADAPKPMAKALGSEFGAIIICTTQYAHEDIWNYTASETGVIASGTTDLIPGQRLDVVVAFGGAANRGGKAEVTYDVTITKPDGTQQSAAKDLIGRRGKALDPKLVSHPEQLLNLSFSAQDAPGTYRIAATVKDHVANLQVTVAQDVQLLAGNSPVALPAGFDTAQASEWITHYYLNPQPRLLVPVLMWISKDTTQYSNPNAWPPVLGLSEMILRDNPWLVSAFVARLANAGTPTAERATLLYVLAYVYRDDDNFALQLPESDREYFQLARHQHWPDPSPEIIAGGQLDVLWGRFFATGAYAPIQALVAVLDHHVYHGKIEEFKKLAVKPAQPPVEVLKEVTFNAALWSLKANAKQHRLVHDYCAQILKNYHGTDNDVRVLLGIIVEATVHTPDGREIDLSKPPGK